MWCCSESNSLCDTFVIGKVATGMVSRGAQWCGVANPEKNASDPVSKMSQRPLRQKRGSPNSRLASAYYIPNNALPWKQCHVITLLSSVNSACAHRSACRPSEAFLYQTLLVMLCFVFVGECIVINFKWLSKNINADASNLIGKAKFVVAVVGSVTILSTDAALESCVPQQSPGSGNTNITMATVNLCHSLTSHHACTSAAANEKSWVAQWTTQMVPWVVRNNFGLSDIKYWKQNCIFW